MDDVLRGWLGSACDQSGFGWTPEVFWRATLNEYFATLESHNRFARGGQEPATREDLEELMAEYPDVGSSKDGK